MIWEKGKMIKTCDCEPFNSCPDCRKDLSKPGKPKKQGKTIEEISHSNRIASLGCVICGGVACVHHIRIFGEPRDHYKIIPLCWNHHQGPDGLHHLGKRAWRERFGHELDMLKIIERRMC